MVKAKTGLQKSHTCCLLQQGLSAGTRTAVYTAEGKFGSVRRYEGEHEAVGVVLFRLNNGGESSIYSGKQPTMQCYIRDFQGC